MFAVALKKSKEKTAFPGFRNYNTMMEKRLLFACLFAAVILFSACKEDDAPVITGDINGTVSVFDGYGYTVSDKSNVQVELSNESTLLIRVTDAGGQYSFEGAPIGDYRIHLIKENYVESVLDFQLSHAGGTVPTETSQTLNEIPEYKYVIDSFAYKADTLYYNVKVIGASKTILNSPIFANCFFSKSPDVSSKKFEHAFITELYPGPEKNVYEGSWPWWNVAHNILKDYEGTIYCRFYPQTYYQEIYPLNGSVLYDVRLETLGEPSDVFSFSLE
jgi:hypothetical protein